jgi:hypothetical protein
MFASRYFPGRYFTRRHWPAIGGVIVRFVSGILSRFGAAKTMAGRLEDPQIGVLTGVVPAGFIDERIEP